MPVSCFSSSAPASQGRTCSENGSCFGALLRACTRSKSASWGEDQIGEFEKNPNFKKISEEEFHKLYKVKKTIGVGGFSIVRKGKHIPTGQDVAIKVIDRSKYDPNDGSLEAEILVLYKVHHPYCISFKECYFTRKHVYVITELVTGGELLDRILNKGKYKEHTAARIMNQLLEGVAYLHSIGVMHRDLKLENILLKSPDDDAPIKIADFGLSKIFAGAAPLTTICGSPQYVAPEVLEVGQNRLSYTPAADLWSTGVIMYILLSGHSPFDDANEAILFQKIKKGMYSMKQPVWETVSYEGKDLMQRLLITMPEKRLTAKQALQHPWFKIMSIDDPKETKAENQGSSGDPQEATQVVSKQLKQHMEAKKEVMDELDEYLTTTPETEGEVPTINKEGLPPLNPTGVQQDKVVPVQYDMSNVQAADEIDEKQETTIQDIGEKQVGTAQTIGEKVGTIVQEIGEQLESMIMEIGEKPEIVVQQGQEPVASKVQEKSSQEISNVTETQPKSAS